MPLASPSCSERTLAVAKESDLAVAKTAARLFAEAAGGNREVQWAFAISVSEAASNMVKFAGGGTVTLRAGLEEGMYVEFEAVDQGPGILEIEKALQDGFSEGQDLYQLEWLDIRKRRGLGTGLGAIRRLMDALEIQNLPQGGLRVRARKRIRLCAWRN